MAQGSVCSGCPTTTPDTPSPAVPWGSQHLPAAPRALQGMNSSRTARPEALLSAGTFSLSSSSSSTSTFGSLKSARVALGTAGTEVRQAPGATLGTGLWRLPAGTGSSWTCWKLEEAGDGQRDRQRDRGVSPTRHLLAPRPHGTGCPSPAALAVAAGPALEVAAPRGRLGVVGEATAAAPPAKSAGKIPANWEKKTMWPKAGASPGYPKSQGLGTAPSPPQVLAVPGCGHVFPSD